MLTLLRVYRLLQVPLVLKNLGPQHLQGPRYEMTSIPADENSVAKKHPNPKP